MINFTIDQLLALDAIARTGSFAAAAADLHKVPSAVSYNVQGLESALGIDVFNRSRRKAELTDAGRRLLEASREVINSARSLDRVASELRDGWEPELHVVVDGAMPMSLVTRCIRRFANPDIPTLLRVDVEYQEGVTDRFDGAPADVALMLGFDGNGDEEGYDCIPLEGLDFVLVASPEHPLSEDVVTSEKRVAHAELIVRDSSPRYSIQPKGSFIGSRNVVYLADFYSKRIALLDSAGYGWIPLHLIEEDLEKGRLVKLDTEPNQWTYSPQIITHEGRHLGRGGQLFLDILREEINLL